MNKLFNELTNSLSKEFKNYNLNESVQLSMSKLEESLEGKKQTAKNRLNTRIANRSRRSVTGKPDVITTR